MRQELLERVVFWIVFVSEAQNSNFFLVAELLAEKGHNFWQIVADVESRSVAKVVIGFPVFQSDPKLSNILNSVEPRGMKP